jgi:predicted GNAT superfamily acetyltransferase
MATKSTQPWTLKIVENPQDLLEVEELQRVVWSGSETEIVPLHLLITIAQNGGVIIGAYEGVRNEDDKTLPTLQKPNDHGRMIGFVYGLPGLYFTPDGPRPKHCSHQLGVHPQHRDRGVGFALKRAQWQMVRRQGLDLISWTYDPLLSRNAYLNITRLGAVCNTYIRELYGDLRDDMNRGLLTDRFRVDWWINTRRVNRRLGRKARLQLDLAHYLAAEAEIVNPSRYGEDGWPHPADHILNSGEERGKDAILLVEIPADFLSLKAASPELAREWRLHTRKIFENTFQNGYLVTDFVYLRGSQPRSFYVLSHGESTL